MGIFYYFPGCKWSYVRALGLAVLWAGLVHAQTLSTLWWFSGPDGALPQDALTLGSDGNFYGVTGYGGAHSCTIGSAQCGTVFKVTAAGVLTTLHSFSGSDGGDPLGALVPGGDGNFYGTTSFGGAFPNEFCTPLGFPLIGCGTVFKVTPTGALTTLYNFNASDGANPESALVPGTDGNFYGTALAGASNGGTFFRITPSGALTTIYNFTQPNESGPIVQSSSGNFYGTSQYGGFTCVGGFQGCGTYFEISPAGVLQFDFFFNEAEGTNPWPEASLIPGGDGNFYGSARSGGPSNAGTIFKLTPTGSLTTLYSFSGPDGMNPFARLALGNDDNFYGTTANGGANNKGTIFKMTPAGVLTPLYSFSGPDGTGPAALTLGTDGNFYGLALAGGGPSGYGAIFKWCLPGGTKLCTGTAVSSSLNPSTFGAAVTLTAMVSSASGSGTPTGLMSFTDGGSPLGSVPLTGGGASLTIAALAPGQYAIRASYGGDSSFQPSSSYLLQTVNQAATSTTVSSNLNPSVYFQPLTFTANVTAPVGSDVPGGTVVFKDGSRTLGTVTLTGGSAAVMEPSLTAGTHSISAAYSGDADHLPSSGLLSQAIGKATSTLTLRAGANPVLTGQAVTFTATAAGQYSGGPTGTVTFAANGVQIGSPVPLSARQAAVTTSFANAGTYSITAAYSGDGNFTGSQAAPLTETVGSALPTTTTVKSSGSPSIVQKPVTFTATIRPSSGTIPNGETVSFYDGTAVIGTAPAASGAAAFTTSLLAAGTHSITAVYAGDATYQSSTSPVFKQVVNKNSTSTTIGASPNPSTFGESVTFTARVSSGGATPTGTVTFKDGATGIGTSATSGGVATFVYSKLAAGTSPITAAYGGDALSANSSSAPVNQVVAQAATTTTVASSKNPSNEGQSVTFTATVSSAFATPTGTVTFTFGAATLGTATLAAGKARLAVSSLPAGTDTVKATFPATTNLGGSSGSILQTVN